MERVPIRLGKLRTSVSDAAPVALPPLRTTEDGDGSQPLLAPASLARVCRVCATRAARYTCPRCNAPYCRVACFQAHGTACTERFYERHVRDELSALDRARGADQRAVSAMLERVQAADQQQLDQEAEQARAERMLALAAADELSLDALTLQERTDFLAQVADGRLGRLVELWSPWWTLDESSYRRETSARRRGLVMQEIASTSAADDNEDDEDEQWTAPVVAAGVAFPAAVFTDAEAAQVPTEWLSAARPSATLRFHVLEALVAYAWVLRAFNGDYAQDSGEAAALLLHLSAVLRSSSARFDSLEHVLLASLELRGDGVQLTDDGANELALRDAAQLIRVRVFVQDALRDAQALVDGHRLELQLVTVADAKKASRKARRQLEAASRKLTFFLRWASSVDARELQALGTELEAAVARAFGGRETKYR